MTNKQESKLKMIRLVILLFTRNQTVINTIQALAMAVEALKNILKQIEQFHSVQSANNTGITVDKDNLREELRDQLLILGGMVFNFADDSGNKEVAARMNLHKSDFDRASLALFNKLCATVIDDCTKAAASLEKYGYKAEMIANVNGLAEEFKTASVKPRQAKVEVSVATDTVAGLFSDAMNILENKTDRLILQLATTEPEFYLEYVNARMIVNWPVQHKKEDAGKNTAVTSVV
jgi:FtsZ-binding cell division protein ZapB